MERAQKQAIIDDLDKKMVFVAGPRQAGKTWLAKEIANEFENSVYLNYDSGKDREIIKDEAWLSDTELLVLDEIHKMPMWKNFLKGVYDTKPEHLKILVTGSARLDIFNQAGDSLAGRYFLHHLMPLSPAELIQTDREFDLNRLLNVGNFPEPFLADSTVNAERWRQQYVDSLLRVDVLDFDDIGNLRAMQLLFDLLKRRVGSSVSYASLAQDIGISLNTVKKYIQVLEALYIVFRVTPFSKNIARSIVKEPKIYFFDTGSVEGDEGAKFENFVAVCLLKHVYAKNDYDAEKFRLHYLRTRDNKEVDFVLAKNDEISQLIEVKLSNSDIDKSLYYFHDKYDLPAIQVVKNIKQERRNHNIDVLSALKFLSNLRL